MAAYLHALAALDAPTLLGLICVALGALGAIATATVSSQSVPEGELVDRLNALLPQTQCGQCGHLGCRPYAEAMLTGAQTNLCPPGGEITARRLARLLNAKPAALDPAHMRPLTSSVARIREDECIGCTKCIQACPTDAIFGAAKRMHSIIESECNGCDLCVEPCPVDCIDLIERDNASEWRTLGGRP